MKIILFITIGFSILFVSCSESAKNEISKQVTPSSVSDSKAQKQRLEEFPMCIDNSSFQYVSISSDNKKLADKDLFKLNVFTRLKDGQDQFSYYILKELNFGDSFKSFLIYEDYESESAIWLANYDEDYNLIDALEVYYDNAEGAWTTTAKIYRKQHLIELTQYDAYGTPDTTIKKVTVSPSGKIKQ